MKLRKILSVILSVVMIAAWITVPVSADKGTVVYQKSGDWSIKGEHNYLWVTNDLGLESGKKYIIEFGVTVPTINSWPSFMFDWRDGSNNTKTNVGWNGYIGLTGFFNDGSNDCVCNAGEVWSGTVGREGGIVNYDYSILWDTATSKFDITIDYTTPGGKTGTITDTFTSSSAYNGGDVLKFWANGEAIVKNLTIYNYSEFVPTIYTEVNGWSLPVSDSGAQATELEDGRLQMNHEVRFTPALEENKKYSIRFDVSGIETGDAWTYQFRLALISGGTTLDGALSYRQGGVWENGNESKWVASGTDGEIEVIIDKATGEYEMYALGALSASGTFADTSDFTLKMYKWGGNAPYISNVRVEEIRENVIYTAENGWTLPANGDDVTATELDDGRLQLNNEATFKPTLEAGKKYSIKYDVTGLETGDAWTFPFRVKMTAGGATTDGILAYRMEGVWEARSLAIAHGNGTNEIIIDTKANTWEAYARGSLSTYGTVDNFNDFALTFYKWGGPSACIGNVTVEEIVFDGTYYEQNFDQIGAEFSNWRAATVNEVRATQPLQVWSGDFGTTGEDKYLLSGAMDIYPLAVTPKTDKYEVSFDIKPNAATDPNGSNWEGIVMQWNLGSSNSDSWHDMKIGTSQGANVAGEVTIDRLWIFGQEMVIDPTQWINVNLVYDCNTGKINAKVTQGNREVKASASFTLASSLTGSPKLTFEGIERNSVKYAGVYLDNIVIRDSTVVENVIYTEENGWTLPTNGDGATATELEDGRLQINNEAIFKPTLEAGKKYSIKYDVTDLAIEAGSWTFPFRVKMSAGGTTTDGILAYRMANIWEARSLAIASGNGSNEIIIDTKANTWEAYARGSLSTYGTVDNFNDFALTFYKWGGPSACIGNVTVEEIVFDGTYYEQNFDQIGAEFSNWRAATVNEVRATQPLQVWSGDFGTTGEDKYLLSGSMDIYPLAVTPKTDKYELNFDVKPNAVTDPNGSNWEGIVMQWNLGSSNADSWHDMKIGTSQGANIEGEVAIDRLWIFGKEMVIDPTQWVNVNIMYDCKSSTINAKVAQGSNVVTASAGFAYDASSLTGAPKIIFEGLERNSVKYAGVYIDNIEINAVGENEAPVLTANSIKIYADGIEQQALNASAFTNKVEVIFGQVMWSEDMSMEKIYVVDSNGNKVTGEGVSASYDNDTYTLIYENGFKGNQTYVVRVEKVRNIEGVYTLEVYEKSFYVAGGVFAELISVTQNGNVIEDAAELLVGNAKINVNYSNTEDTTPVMHIVVAYYNEGKLVLADCVDKTAEANVTSIKCELDYNIKDVPEGCDEIQIMVWDGFDTIKPLSAPLTL